MIRKSNIRPENCRSPSRHINGGSGSRGRFFRTGDLFAHVGFDVDGQEIKRKCLKFKVPKMPKIKDANHFMKDKIPKTNNK